MNIKQSKLARLGAAALVVGGLLIGTLTGAASAAELDRYGGPSGQSNRSRGRDILEHSRLAARCSRSDGAD